MPICAKCSKPLVCACAAPPQVLGEPVKPCPLQDGALWVHVLDDTGANVKSVVVQKDGAADKPTDANGLATYDPLPAGTYKASLPKLGGEPAKQYVAPKLTEQSATVSPGQITYVGFELQRKAQLKVKTALQGDASKVFGDAEVEVAEGPDKPPAAKTSGLGLVDFVEKFGLLAPGTYKIKGKLGTEDAKKYQTVKDFDKELQEVELGAGEAGAVTIDVEAKNLVAPKIELEYKVVLLNRKLAQHQDAKETPVLPTATRVELSFTESDAGKPDQAYAGKHKFDQGAVFNCSGTGTVEVFLDEACKDKLPSSGEISGAQLPSGGKRVLYLRGVTPGTFTAKLTLKDSTDRFVQIDQKEATEAMGVVELEMTLHHYDAADFDGLRADPDLPPPAGKNYNPWVTPNDSADYHADLLKKYHKTLKDLALPAQKPMTDAQKMGGLGRVLCQQSGNAGDDHARAKLVVKQLVAAQWPAGTDNYQIYLNRTNRSGAVVICDAETAGKELAFPVSAGLKVSELKAAEKVFWVEGKTPTDAAGAVQLDLTLDRDEGDGALAKEAKRHGDCARFTVVAFKELKIDYTPEPGKPVRWIEKDSKAYINLTGEGAGAITADAARTFKLAAQLSAPVAGVRVHFMLAPDKGNQTATNGGEPLPPGSYVRFNPAVALTLEGRDVGCFEIRNNKKLYLRDGVLAEARKPVYWVKVVGTYSDGSVARLDYVLHAKHSEGVDTTAGVLAKTYGDADFKPTKEPLWKWDTIAKAVKHKDKAARDHYLHVWALTDDKGCAKAEVMLSRMGGDIFHPACYVDQDPHLAKYVDGHTDLEKREPYFAEKSINVWRKFWVQRVVVEGVTARDFDDAIVQYARVIADMELHDDLAVKRDVVDRYSRKVIYPEYMVKVGGGTKDVLVISDVTKRWPFNQFKAVGEKPNMIPILVCDAQWDPDGNSTGKSSPPRRKNAFPVSIDMGTHVIDPPLQGGSLLVSGKWKCKKWNDATNDWDAPTEGNLVAGDLFVDRNRDSLDKVSVQLPAGANADHASELWIEDLVVKGAAHYLGESFDKKILAVYDPAEPVDFQNTIAHEIGHAFQQVIQGTPSGNLPVHPNQVYGQGNHCRHVTNLCVMFDSGPIEGSLNRYCKICHPYLQWQDMSTIV